LAQAPILFFLLRRFSSFFAMGYGDRNAGLRTLATSMKSVFDQPRNAVRLAPEYAINAPPRCAHFKANKVRRG
jgi:hypothetical protein